MESTTGIREAVSTEELKSKERWLAEFNHYLATQHPIVRGLHLVLKGLAMICFVLPIIFGVIALYQTYLWAATGSFSSLGKATYLPIAWVNFGLSCSFLVFSWGLDAMLMRAFPTDAFLVYVYGQVRKPIRFMTGLGAFVAGLGVVCAGAPGAAYMLGLASQALQKFF